jgi:hypothetical protein
MDIKVENGDIVIENNDLVLVQGVDETSQNLLANLQTFQGEWFKDTSVGVPYMQDIFVKGTPVNIISGIFKDTIAKTDGVEEINEFELDYDNQTRQLLVKAKVTSKDGDIVLSASLP